MKETNIQNSIQGYKKVVLILVPRVLLMIFLKKIIEIDSNKDVKIIIIIII